MKLKDLIKEDFPEAIIPELMISLQIDDRIQKFHKKELYQRNSQFKKIMNKKDPRDGYNMFINHWLDAELKRL